MLFAFASVLSLGAVLALTVRTGPWLARGAAALAMLALAIAAFVPPDVVVERVPSEVALVGTDGDGLRRAAAAAAARDPASTAEFVVIACTDLREGLARAAMQVGPRLAERVVLWSAPLAALPAAGARAAGFSFSTAPPLAFAPDDLQVEFEQAPRAKRPLRAHASLRGRLPSLRGRFAVRGAALEAEAEGALGGGRSLLLEAVPEIADDAVVEVRADVGGHRVARTGRIAVGAPEQVLVLDPSGVCAAALEAQGLDVRSETRLLPDLAGVSAVVLGVALDPEAQRTLVAAVKDGLGLLAFGPGLQRDGEPLRDALPLRLLPSAGSGAGPGPEPSAEPPEPEPVAQPKPTPPQKIEDPQVQPGGPVEVDRHSVAMVLVIDRSGSMGTRVFGGGTKMSYAKTSARQTANALMLGDEVGVVSFGDDEQARIELPLTGATDRESVERGLDKLAHANERTYLDHGLVTATRMLANSKAAVRHVVVLTDGEVWDQELVLRRRAHTMRQQGMTVSIVSIVDDRTPPSFQATARNVANEGGGLFLPVRDVRSVPQLVSAEVERALDRVGRKPRGNGEEVDPKQPPEPPPPEPAKPQPAEPEPVAADPADVPLRAVARTPLLAPDPGQWPALRGILGAAARRTAHVLLVAGDEGLPVLAFHNHALGRVGAFAADLVGPPAIAFRAEPGFPARLAQWATAVRRPGVGAVAPTFSTSSIEPPAPTPNEAAALSALAGSPVLQASLLKAPPARTILTARTRVPEWALVAGFVLVLLAALERWLVHRSG